MRKLLSHPFLGADIMLVGGFSRLKPLISGARCIEPSINWLKFRYPQVALALLRVTSTYDAHPLPYHLIYICKTYGSAP